MAKKDFNLDRIMKTEKPAAAKPAPKTEKPKEPADKLPVFSFRIEPETADMIKDYAYTKRISIKDAVTVMVETFIDDYYNDPNNEPLLPHKR